MKFTIEVNRYNSWGHWSGRKSYEAEGEVMTQQGAVLEALITLEIEPLDCNESLEIRVEREHE